MNIGHWLFNQKGYACSGDEKDNIIDCKDVWSRLMNDGNDFLLFFVRMK